MGKLYVIQRDGVEIPVGMRRRLESRPSTWRRFSRTADRMITRTQEWLEAPDRGIDHVIAYLFVMAMVAILGVALARMGD